MNFALNFAEKQIKVDLFNRVRETIEKYNLFAVGERIVAAISGGSDSMCLLDILNRLRDEYNLEVVVSHFNHHLQEKADQQQLLVQQIAANYHMKFTQGECDVRSYARENRLSVEVAARRLRYLFFEKICRQVNANKVVTAHHLDDLIETALIRLLRGCAPAGIVAILPIRKFQEHDYFLVRPLIEVTKENILLYVQQNNIVFIEDPSNSDIRYLRNRIRCQLIPYIQNIQRNFKKNFARFIMLLNKENSYLDAQVNKIEYKKYEWGYIFNRDHLKKLDEALLGRLLCQKISSLDNYAELNARNIIKACQLIYNSKNAKIALKGNIYIDCSYGEVLLYKAQKELLQRLPMITEFDYQLPVNNTLFIKECNIYVTLEIIDNVDAKYLSWVDGVEYFDATKVQLPLYVRNKRPGDRIKIANNATKKLHDLFIDLKVPKRLRETTPLIVDSSGCILWVVGYRRAYTAYIWPNQTSTIIKLKIEHAK